jgi:hypothetical protein
MDELDREIEMFRTEEEEAQQYLFACLGVRSLLVERPDVVRMVNRNSMYWITSHQALLLAALIAFGRIFDQRKEIPCPRNKPRCAISPIRHLANRDEGGNRSRLS